MAEGRRFDAALCGYFGFGNFGDEALLSSALENLELCGVPRERVCVMSASPDETGERFRVAAVNRWRPRDVIAALRASRSMLMPGGGLFQDATSARSCAYYWAVVKLARLCGCRVWALGQSIGPLTSVAGRRLAASALRSTEYLRVRDDASLEAALSLGANAQIMPDTARGLDLPEAMENPCGRLLVNVRPDDGAAIRAAAAAIRGAAAAGVELAGAAMSPDDEAEFERLFGAGEIPRFPVSRPETPEGFAALADGARGAFGMRLHFVIMASEMGLPTAAAAYDPKVASFARVAGLDDLSDGGENSDLWERLLNKTLTNGPVSDKRKRKKAREAVRDEFRRGASAILGVKN